jgi:hypothetical protein
MSAAIIMLMPHMFARIIQYGQVIDRHGFFQAGFYFML